jgi:hypothetical protein
MSRIRRLGFSVLIAGMAAAMPFAIGMPSGDAGNGLIRLQDACGQATECALAMNYICIGNEDHKNYRCSKGCEKEIT